MAYTVLMFVYRKAGTTPDQFKQHYEQSHVPLMKTLAGEAFPLHHTRRYIQRQADEDENVGAANTGDTGFDCITEMVFGDEAGFRILSGLLASPGVADQVKDDCEAFMEANKTQVFIVADTVKTDGDFV